jgi:hypothetical protein
MGFVAAGIGLLGVAGGVMGAMGDASAAEAQYAAQKIEVERNNFQNNLANDKKNFVAARNNALRRWNNRKIGEAAVKNYSDTSRSNRLMHQDEIHSAAKAMLSYRSGLTGKAVGRGVRGGMAGRMQMMAKTNAKNQRLNLRKSKYAADTSAKAQYEAALNQRDLLSYESANIFMPGSLGSAPGSNTLGMLSGALSGGISGVSAGLGMKANYNKIQGT